MGDFVTLVDANHWSKAYGVFSCRCATPTPDGVAATLSSLDFDFALLASLEQGDQRTLMRLEIPSDLGEILRQRAAAEGYSSVVEFLYGVVSVASTATEPPANLDSSQITPVYDLPYDDWKQRFDEFVATCTTTNPTFHDSRESIYQDRD